MTNSPKLHLLLEKHESRDQKPNNQVIEQQINTIKKAIA